MRVVPRPQISQTKATAITAVTSSATALGQDGGGNSSFNETSNGQISETNSLEASINTTNNESTGCQTLCKAPQPPRLTVSRPKLPICNISFS